MKEPPPGATSTVPATEGIKDKVRNFLLRVKRLQGDPHYVALGMAIGVFVSATPTIPFHTLLAVTLAFLLKGSKPAAAIGVWASNPLTMPFLYLGAYKIGKLILGHRIPMLGAQASLQDLFKLGFSTTGAMILGGALLGIVPAVVAYYLTRRIITRVRRRARRTGGRKTLEASLTVGNPGKKSS